MVRASLAAQSVEADAVDWPTPILRLELRYNSIYLLLPLLLRLQLQKSLKFSTGKATLALHPIHRLTAHASTSQTLAR